MEENIAPPVKKKPGRPKKPTNTVPLEMIGISNEPANADDIIELIYKNPFMFKKITRLCKLFFVSEIEMQFDPTGITIECVDHLEKSRIYIQIDGRCMNLYYCKESIRACIRRDNLEKVLDNLGKNHCKITFILKENQRSSMYIIVTNQDYNNEDVFEIDILHSPEKVRAIVADDDTDYPLRFCFTTKFLKGHINNFKKMSSALIIQKCGLGPLTFVADKTKKMDCSSTFSDPAKINLQSTIAEGDILNVSVCIDYITPFSTSGVGDEVTIAVDKFKSISFTTHLDKEKDIGWAATIKIFTDIIDHRIFKI